MKNLRRKRKIEILGVPHRIKYEKIENPEDGGYYSPSDKEIIIDRETTIESEYMDDLLHECLHGVLDISGAAQNLTLIQEHCIIDPIVSFLRNNRVFELRLKK